MRIWEIDRHTPKNKCTMSIIYRELYNYVYTILFLFYGEKKQKK